MDAFQEAGWTVDGNTAMNHNLVDTDGNQITKMITIYSRNGDLNISIGTYPGETPPADGVQCVGWGHYQQPPRSAECPRSYKIFSHNRLCGGIDRR